MTRRCSRATAHSTTSSTSVSRWTSPRHASATAALTLSAANLGLINTDWPRAPDASPKPAVRDPRLRWRHQLPRLMAQLGPIRFAPAAELATGHALRCSSGHRLLDQPVPALGREHATLARPR